MISSSVHLLLQKYGRPMTLRRKGTPDKEVTVNGTGPRSTSPSDAQAGAIQSNVSFTISPPSGDVEAPPRRGDLVVSEGRTYTVQDAMARREGETISAYDLFAKG
jgi:hypothetical protein